MNNASSIVLRLREETQCYWEFTCIDMLGKWSRSNAIRWKIGLCCLTWIFIRNERNEYPDYSDKHSTELTLLLKEVFGRIYDELYQKLKNESECFSVSDSFWIVSYFLSVCYFATVQFSRSARSKQYPFRFFFGQPSSEAINFRSHSVYWYTRYVFVSWFIIIPPTPRMSRL